MTRKVSQLKEQRVAYGGIEDVWEHPQTVPFPLSIFSPLLSVAPNRRCPNRNQSLSFPGTTSLEGRSDEQASICLPVYQFNELFTCALHASLIIRSGRRRVQHLSLHTWTKLKVTFGVCTCRPLCVNRCSWSGPIAPIQPSGFLLNLGLWKNNSDMLRTTEWCSMFELTVSHRRGQTAENWS